MGRSIWTIVENDERFVEAEADIEDVQLMALRLPVNTTTIKIKGIEFPADGIIAILEMLASSRISYVLDDKLYGFNLAQLEILEATVDIL